MADNWQSGRHERRAVNRFLLGIVVLVAVVFVLGVIWWAAAGSEVAGPVEAPASGAPL